MPIKPTLKLLQFFLLLAAALVTCACARSPQAKAARFMSRGKEAMKKKDYNRALLEFLNAVQVMPQDAEAYYQLGEAYLANGAVGPAANALLKATRIDPRHVQAQLALSTLMAGSGDLRAVDEARKRLSAAHEQEPDNPDILDVLALARFRQGKLGEAEEELEQALQKLPSHLSASVYLARIRLERKDMAGAQEVLENAVKANPQSAEAALVLGRFYLVSGKPQLGEAELRRSLQIDPKNGPALLTLAERQFDSGRTREAERTYRQLSGLPDRNYSSLHAAFLFKTGQRDAALAEFEALARQSPYDRAARTRLIAAYSASGRTADAENVLKTALQKNPRDTEALLQRSRMRLVSGKYSDAESDVRQVLNFKPESAEAHYYLSKVYRASHSTQNERQELTEALRYDPGFLAARVELAQLLIASRNPGAALQVMNETPEAQRKTLQALGARNWALMALGDDAAAREGVNAGLARARVPELLLQDGALKMTAKDPAGAQVSIDEALKLVPDSVQAWQFLGMSYSTRKEPQKAIERLQAAIVGMPQAAGLQLLLGQWLAQTGRTTEARAAFEAARKADPKLSEADLSLAQMDMREGNMDRSRQDLAAVLAIQPQNTTARVFLGEIDKKAGDWDRAIAEYRAVLDLEQTNVVALNQLAFMLSRDKPGEAMKFAQRAGELAPDNPAVQDTLGWVYYRNGIYDSAVGYLKNAVAKQGTPQRKYHLGLALLKSGQRDEGQTILNAALSADPTLATTQGW
jgi:tetratricopeptide (TPR) repeat protein